MFVMFSFAKDARLFFIGEVANNVFFKCNTKAQHKLKQDQCSKALFNMKFVMAGTFDSIK